MIRICMFFFVAFANFLEYKNIFFLFDFEMIFFFTMTEQKFEKIIGFFLFSDYIKLFLISDCVTHINALCLCIVH